MSQRGFALLPKIEQSLVGFLHYLSIKKYQLDKKQMLSVKYKMLRCKHSKQRK